MVKETDSFQDSVVEIHLAFQISTDRFESNLFGKFDCDSMPVLIGYAGCAVLFSVEIEL